MIRPDNEDNLGVVISIMLMLFCVYYCLKWGGLAL